MSNNMHPEILDGLDYEHQFIQRTSGAQRRTVKLNRGDSWLLRFLPATIGPNKRWYARVAKHWVNQRAIVCPRQTEEAFGGHPDAYCPVCELSDHLNNERSEDVSKFGFKLRATPNWITYCAVFAKATQGGGEQQMPLPEVLLPYEFPHYKTSWEELTGFVKQGVRRTPMSVLDLEKGNDFYVSKTAKGLRLDKQDAQPIFPLDDPNFDASVQKLLAACKDPVVKIPDDKDLDTFADKAQEEANNVARGGGARNGARGGARPARDEDDLPPEDGGHDAPPARGRRFEQQEAPQDAPPARGRTAAPAAEAPARRPVTTATPTRAATATAAPARRTAPAPEPPVDEQGGDYQGDPNELPPEDQGGEPPVDEQPPEPPPAAPARRTAPATAPAAPARPSSTTVNRPSATRTAPAAAARSSAPAAAAPARTAPRGGPVAQESIDEHEHVPEEATDQAPPAPLVDPNDDPGAGDPGEAPPPVANNRRGQFAASIRGKIAAVDASSKK